MTYLCPKSWIPLDWYWCGLVASVGVMINQSPIRHLAKAGLGCSQDCCKLVVWDRINEEGKSKNQSTEFEILGVL